MKNLKLLTFLWVILLAGTLVWCKNNSNDIKSEDQPWDLIIEDITWETDAVVNYNDTLVDLAFNCIMSEDNIWNIYDNWVTEIEDIQKAIDGTISECTNAWNSIRELGDWKWDSSLKDWVLNIIEKEIAYYTKFNELLPYLQKEELTEEENEAYDKLFSEVETLDEELSQANDNLISTQEQFAENYWFELESIDEGNEPEGNEPEEITE